MIEEGTPRRHEVVQHPVDFISIENRVDRGDFTSFDEVVEDIRLAFFYAVEYNGMDQGYSERAGRLSQEFEANLRNMRGKE